VRLDAREREGEVGGDRGEGGRREEREGGDIKGEKEKT
jgi:hypothetical protein